MAVDQASPGNWGVNAAGHLPLRSTAFWLRRPLNVLPEGSPIPISQEYVKSWPDASTESPKRNLHTFGLRYMVLGPNSILALEADPYGLIIEAVCQFALGLV